MECKKLFKNNNKKNYLNKIRIKYERMLTCTILRWWTFILCKKIVFQMWIACGEALKNTRLSAFLNRIEHPRTPPCLLRIPLEPQTFSTHKSFSQTQKPNLHLRPIRRLKRRQNTEKEMRRREEHR
jgi:hypothetical protein